MKTILKELTIYFAILLLMGYGMHGSTLPEHIDRVMDDPFLFVHSLWWAFAGYTILIIPRLIIRLIKSKLTNK